jgi:hypothetical protein
VTTLTPLLAAWFANPVLLGGLGLTVVPILIHLLSRRRFRRIAWGATRFLLEAERENRRRVRFERWLLIALRCLAMALLALLVARPFVEPGLVASLLGGRGQVQRVILIDDSASLAFCRETTQDFALLREAGQRLLGWLHDAAADDPVTVYLTSQPAEPLVAGRRLTAASFADLQARVAQLEPVNLPARPRRVLEAVAEDLSAVGKGARADVYVLSDFQRSEWLALDSGGASVFEPLNRLSPEAVRVVLIAIGPAVRDNVAVLDAQLERPRTVAGLPAVVQATIANYSREPLVEAHVQLEVNGAPLPPVPVETIAAGGSRTVSVELTFPDEGFSEVAVGLDAVDGLPADDTRRLALLVKRALSVLLVNGEPAVDPVRDEVYFLRNALAPAGPFSSGIRVETTGGGRHPACPEIEAIPLDRFDCVALCNVAPPGEGAVAALQRYVQKGGGLLFFLGEQVGDPQEYNRVFYAGGEGLLPLPLKELRRHDDASEGVGLVGTGDHAVTAMFSAGGGPLSESVRFRRYYRCDEPSPAQNVSSVASEDQSSGEPSAAQTPAVVLARFSDDRQTAALVERAFGRGRVLLFTSSVDLDWNDWARAMDGSYVVTLLELIQYAARRQEERLSFVAGETLTCSLLPEEYEASAVFRGPGSADEAAVEGHVREPPGGVGEPVVVEGPVATRLGTYRAELVRRGGEVEQRPLAVNCDATESDLAVAGAHELDAALGRVGHEYVQAAAAFQQDDARARRELWRAVLLVLVAVLMVEQALGWWFGMPGRAVRTRETRGGTSGLGVGTK